MQNHLTKNLSRIALASGLCLMAWTVSAAEIRDDAKLFSPDVVATAREKLSAAETAAKHGVTIETYATLPQGKAGDVEKMSASEKARFYSDLLKQRAKQAHAEGIFVLITKDPGHVEVGVSGKLQSAGYTAASKKQLVDTFLTAFRQKEFDRGLTGAVSQIETSQHCFTTHGECTGTCATGGPGSACATAGPHFVGDDWAGRCGGGHRAHGAVVTHAGDVRRLGRVRTGSIWASRLRRWIR
jgi:hypothetical protein